MLKKADVDDKPVEKISRQLVDGVLFTTWKLVSIAYSYPYQLITILDVKIAYKEDMSVMYLTINF